MKATLSDGNAEWFEFMRCKVHDKLQRELNFRPDARIWV